MEKFLVREIIYDDRPNEVFIYSRGKCDNCLVKDRCDDEGTPKKSSKMMYFNICGSIDKLFHDYAIVRYIIKSRMSPYISKLSIKYGEICSK